MRGYLWCTKFDEKNARSTYFFTSSIAQSWNTFPRQHAERILRRDFIEHEVSVKSQDAFAMARCTDPQVERRSDGRFVISCEVPFC
jgi:hypothetical protein